MPTCLPGPSAAAPRLHEARHTLLCASSVRLELAPRDGDAHFDPARAYVQADEPLQPAGAQAGPRARPAPHYRCHPPGQEVPGAGGAGGGQGLLVYTPLADQPGEEAPDHWGGSSGFWVHAAASVVFTPVFCVGSICLPIAGSVRLR